MWPNPALAAQQYQVIRDRLRSQEPELDEQTLADTVEGLTDLHEVVAVIIRFALVDEAMAIGLKELIAVMQRRLERLEERAAKRRLLARDAMVTTEIKKIAAPEFTVSIRPGTPALVVLDEAQIPPRFWEPRDPRLNRQAVLAELKRGAEITGAQLSNPESVLSVRIR